MSVAAQRYNIVPTQGGTVPGVAGRGGGTWVGTAREEEACHLEIAVPGGPVQGRGPFVIARVDVGSLLQEEDDGLAIAVPRGVMKGCRSIVLILESHRVSASVRHELLQTAEISLVADVDDRNGVGLRHHGRQCGR